MGRVIGDIGPGVKDPHTAAVSVSQPDVSAHGVHTERASDRTQGDLEVGEGAVRLLADQGRERVQPPDAARHAAGAGRLRRVPAAGV